jgi:hypothetical protein
MKKNYFKLLCMVLAIGLTLSGIFPLVSAAALADSTPPADITGLSAVAGDSRITLTWKDPEDADFAKVKITGAGRTVYVGKGLQTVTIDGLANDVQYAFRLATLDGSGNMSLGITVSAVPKDTTAPEAVTALSAEIKEGSLLLTWKDPTCSDLERIRIMGNDNIYYIDKGVQLLTIGELTNNSYGTYTVKAIDTSGNESVDSQITVVREADAAISLEGPTIVQQGSEFTITAALSCARQDVYAADLKVSYSSELFEYLGFREAGNDIYVASVEETTPCGLRVFTISNKPVTGKKVPMILLDFKAKSDSLHQNGSISVEKAMVGTAPDGYSIPASVSEMDIKVSTIVLPDVSDASIVSGDKKVTLTWKDPEGIAFDHILISGDGFSSRSIAKGIQTAVIDSLINGKAYNFVISVADKDGNTSKGIQLSSTPGAEDHTAPEEVTGLTVKADNGKFIIRWTDPADADLSGIVITGSGITGVEIAKGVQEKVIEGLENGKLYTLLIKTRDIAGNESSGLAINGRPGITGDINYDGVIDVADLAVFVYYYKVKEGDPLWEDARICDLSGMNGIPDGIVDISDLVFVASKIMDQQ